MCTPQPKKRATLSIESLASTSKVIVLPVSVFTKICMPPRRRSTKCKVDSLPRVYVSDFDQPGHN